MSHFNFSHQSIKMRRNTFLFYFSLCIFIESISCYAENFPGIAENERRALVLEEGSFSTKITRVSAITKVLHKVSFAQT